MTEMDHGCIYEWNGEFKVLQYCTVHLRMARLSNYTVHTHSPVPCLALRSLSEDAQPLTTRGMHIDGAKHVFPSHPTPIATTRICFLYLPLSTQLAANPIHPGTVLGTHSIPPSTYPFSSAAEAPSLCPIQTPGPPSPTQRRSTKQDIAETDIE